MKFYLQARAEGQVARGWQLTKSNYSFGRAQSDGAQHLSFTDDPTMSRHHFDIEVGTKAIFITRNPKARNPIFFKGVEAENFELHCGEAFLTGKTRFSLSEVGSLGQLPTTEYTMLRTQLQLLQEENSGASFRTMLELLPKLRQSRGSEAAFRSALDVLTGLLPQASEVKALRVSEVLETVFRLGKSPTATPPSRRLVQSALDQKATVAHVWALEQEADIQATAHARADWAVASPVAISDDEQFCLYAVGRSAMALSEAEVRKQKKSLDEIAALLDIVGETLSHHLTTEKLNRFEGQVGQFFSPGLRERLTDRDFQELLKPHIREVTVLFFDLRGFSKATESAEDEALEQIMLHHDVLTRVMTEVTEEVFKKGGLVIDYQGDAVMACWGALTDESQACEAAEAAVAIVKRIHEFVLPFPGEKLRCGVGLATGKVVAGQVGARKQIKFGVLGKTVNLASRLEGLTKYFGVPILINQNLKQQLGCSCLCRCVGEVRPAGLSESVEVFELVLPKELGGTGLSEEKARAYSSLARSLRDGSRNQILQELLIPDSSTDQVARFLTEVVQSRSADDWDGIIEFSRK